MSGSMPAIAAALGWTPLHRAAWRGDVAGVRALLDDGAPVDARAVDGWTPLAAATLEGHAAVVAVLLERGAPTNAVSTMHPLHRLPMLACASGDLATVRLFMSTSMPVSDPALFFVAAHTRAGHRVAKVRDHHISDGDMVGFETETPERWAIEGPLELDDDTMALLQPHLTAIEGGDGCCVAGVEMVRADARVPFAEEAPCLRPALRDAIFVGDLGPHVLGDRALSPGRLEHLRLQAIRRGDRAIVAALQIGRTPEALFAAVLADNPELVADLLDDPDEKQTTGPLPRLTALGVAARFAKPRVVSLLLERGAKVERAGGGRTPLLWACQATGPAAVETVTALLEHRARLEATHEERTPLMYAVMKGDAAIVERLLRAGAAVNARGPVGLSPLHHVGFSARGGHHVDVIDLLLGFGADLHAVDDRGWTVVHMAGTSDDEGRRAVLQHLIALGVDVDAPDHQGRTALDLASRARSPACPRACQLLADASARRRR